MRRLSGLASLGELTPDQLTGESAQRPAPGFMAGVFQLLKLISREHDIDFLLVVWVRANFLFKLQHLIPGRFSSIQRPPLRIRRQAVIPLTHVARHAGGNEVAQIIGSAAIAANDVVNLGSDRRGAVMANAIVRREDCPAAFRGNRHDLSGLLAAPHPVTVCKFNAKLAVRLGNPHGRVCRDFPVIVSLEPGNRVGGDLGEFRHFVQALVEQGAGGAALGGGNQDLHRRSLLLCWSTHYAPKIISGQRLIFTNGNPYDDVSAVGAADTPSTSRQPTARYQQPIYGRISVMRQQRLDVADMSTTFSLSPNPDHMSAARSFRLARNALNHAKMCPWTREREEETKRQWIESARHWQRMAEFAKNPRNERWSLNRPNLSWEAELAILLTRYSAISAEVE
jgi:hypothetical protein